MKHYRGISLIITGIGFLFLLAALTSSYAPAISAAPTGPIQGPPAPTATDEPALHICIVVDFEEAPNNIAPIMNGDEKLGEIIYNPEKNSFEHRDAEGTIIQQGTIPEEHALVGVEIPDTDKVVVTEFTSCGGQLFYLQVTISKEKWDLLLQKSETDDA